MYCWGQRSRYAVCAGSLRRPLGRPCISPSDTTTRVDFDVLSKLCRYFGCGVGELLVYRPEEAPAQGEEISQPAAARPF
ncbi:MAG: helix-turn-helix domain-containing protein [Chloroflexota bacterium]